MTITLDIRPEIEAELTRQAAEHGLGIGAYAASLLEEAVHLPTSPVRLSEPAEARTWLSCLRRCGVSTSIFQRDRDTGLDINL
ncbi:MAG TPA: hypothetical protein VNY05_36595 [Candidatus Acidoferrales bacterium]|jgi:hypothetical protein|nr:hypothetical protein [Candidatus Acidoferrales bacterium]